MPKVDWPTGEIDAIEEAAGVPILREPLAVKVVPRPPMDTEPPEPLHVRSVELDPADAPMLEPMLRVSAKWYGLKVRKRGLRLEFLGEQDAVKQFAADYNDAWTRTT